MTETLNIYRDDEQIASGISPLHVKLDPATYPAGTFKGELVDDSGVKTERFDFPEVVVSAPIIAVTKVTLTPETASIEVGNTTKLASAIEPTNATDTGVNWSSSDTAVATVSGGTVTGKSAGVSTITAMSKLDGKITGTAQVTVIEPPVTEG
ncbi:Ig-like domain-containing protein [Companilactobacillus allii]|uniref:BIG2 domain-containing protein n=1 Tax=Companilactobacillus allii TaxID=1847728 RepID=A0A1P8Q4B4_9LACO|nr:Ig-like domain-containing protein [Companilactobacillus allii]APX72710.1 hypothetical protein BTM29_09170 [Companilactobacillus allii]USQ69817.1 Ig-like domain-containing protein [Companilactobacillus allii]